MSKYMSIGEVLEDLGVHRQTLEHYLRSDYELDGGRVFKPAYMSGNERFFLRSDVEEFKEKYANDRYYSFAEIAKMYGISNTATVHHNFRIARLYEPDAKHGHAFRYSMPKIRAVAHAAGWQMVIPPQDLRKDRPRSRRRREIATT